MPPGTVSPSCRKGLCNRPGSKGPPVVMPPGCLRGRALLSGYPGGEAGVQLVRMGLLDTIPWNV